MPQELFNNARSQTIETLKNIIALLETTDAAVQPMDSHPVMEAFKTLDGNVSALKRTWNAARQNFVRTPDAQSTSQAAARRRLIFEQRLIAGRKIREIAKERGMGVSSVTYDIHRHCSRLGAYASKNNLPYLGLSSARDRRVGINYVVYNAEHKNIFVNEKIEVAFPVLVEELKRLNIDPLEYVRLV